MREIKFRVWDIDKKKMLFYSGIFNTKPSTEMSTFPQYDSMPRFHEVEVMQYTGLKDKNGVEVYEGDVLADNLGKGVVEYIDKYGAFRVNYRNGDCKWFYHYLDSEYRTIEVIGNIYESPELLNGEVKDE